MKRLDHRWKEENDFPSSEECNAENAADEEADCRDKERQVMEGGE